MNGPNQYTAKDIERYHSGQLPPAERHALEKAALDDPFLADALEGYVFTNTPVADLTALQQRLQKRTEETQNPRRLFVYPWMRIAALFVLIAGGGWLVANLFSTNNGPTTIAKEKVQQVNQPASAPDSATVFSDAPPQPDAAFSEPESATTATAHKVRLATGSSRQQAAISERDHQIVADAVKKERADIKTVTRSDSASPDQLLAGRIAGIQTQEAKDDYALRSAPAAKPQATTAPFAKDTINLGNIMLKPDNTNLNEVVIASAKRKTVLPQQRRSYTVDSLEPAEGWVRFDDYVASNLKEPQEIKTKSLKGEVELSFEVNQAGEPVNIVVTKSLCEPCDAEAIRLLREGPKWKKIKKKGKIKIKF